MKKVTLSLQMSLEVSWQKFEAASQYRFIELNCKHFLGRAPLEQAEISRHVQIYNEQAEKHSPLARISI